MPLSNREFLEHLCSENHNLLKGISEMLSVVATFSFWLGQSLVQKRFPQKRIR